jgi:hypothetical protein
MRWLLIVLIAFLMVSCAPKPGKGLYDAISQEDRERTAAITGQVISDAYNEKPCIDDTDCGPGQICVENRCAVKPSAE